jgi:tRNA A37 threonylcarbamoyladenosine dehydratase
MDETRFDRSVRFFGHAGQARLRSTRVAVVGVGGIGTQVVQRLALLGLAEIIAIDPEELDESNRNRYIGVRNDDPIPGTRKVDIADRLISSIALDTTVRKIPHSLLSRESIDALTGATHIFGCLDHDALRLVLTEIAACYSIPYIDCASEILTLDHPNMAGACVSLGLERLACTALTNSILKNRAITKSKEIEQLSTDFRWKRARQRQL